MVWLPLMYWSYESVTYIQNHVQWFFLLSFSLAIAVLSDSRALYFCVQLYFIATFFFFFWILLGVPVVNMQPVFITNWSLLINYIY